MAACQRIRNLECLPGHAMPRHLPYSSWHVVTELSFSQARERRADIDLLATPKKRLRLHPAMAPSALEPSRATPRLPKLANRRNREASDSCMSLRSLHILLLRVVRLWASRKGHNCALQACARQAMERYLASSVTKKCSRPFGASLHLKPCVFSGIPVYLFCLQPDC